MHLALPFNPELRGKYHTIGVGMRVKKIHDNPLHPFNIFKNLQNENSLPTSSFIFNHST